MLVQYTKSENCFEKQNISRHTWLFYQNSEKTCIPPFQMLAKEHNVLIDLSIVRATMQ